MEGGRQRLAQAAQQAVYGREEAALVLSLLDIVVRGDRPAGLARLDTLYRADPRRAFVAYLYGYALLSNSHADDAARILSGVATQQAQPGAQPLDFAVYYLADAQYKLGRYDEAIRNFRLYLQRHRGNALRAGAQIRLGLALELAGRRDEALPFYREIRHTRISETEEMAVRLAQRRLAAPLTPAERTLLESTNQFEAGHSAEAEARLRALLATALPPTLRAETQVRLGRVLKAQTRLADARTAFEAAAAAPGDDPLAGWAPWAALPPRRDRRSAGAARRGPPPLRGRPPRRPPLRLPPLPGAAGPHSAGEGEVGPLPPSPPPSLRDTSPEFGGGPLPERVQRGGSRRGAGRSSRRGPLFPPFSPSGARGAA